MNTKRFAQGVFAALIIPGAVYLIFALLRPDVFWRADVVYLAGLNEQAQVRMETLIEQLKTAEGVTESLKANDPMAWVQRMNSIRARAEEIVREEIIYGEAAV